MKEDKKILLLLGSHAHVPSGALESEFEFVYENKIRPFVSTLYRYSNIQAVLHYSGVLLYWVERNHPEFFMLIEDMIARKQAEILGGGFYEPMFPLIPLQDRIGQIELMTTYLRKHFGKRPLGCWIPGMVWEQHLVAALASSDINYTFLSQEQFKQAGILNEELFSPCISEDQGKLITIFPVSSSVAKDLEEKSFSHVFVELKKKFDEAYKTSLTEKIVCVFPEKVSASPEEAPDTAWNRFFEEISLSENIVETVLPAKIIKNIKKMKKASFPNSSSPENDFSPRRFLIEHNESNGIYSKMIFTNVLINQLKGDKSRKLNAREELWKAQDSVLFTPGNGPQRNELRKSAYSSLLRAERLSREKGKIIPSLVQFDFDYDSIKEYLFQDSIINCYIQLIGASIFELDYLPKEWNYLDCGTNNTSMEAIKGRRTAFADIISPADTKIDSHGNIFNINSRSCFNEQYEPLTHEKKGKFCFKLNSGTGSMPFACIEINKCYLLKRNTLHVSYLIKNNGKTNQNFLFTPEIDLSFAGVTDEYVRFFTVDPDGKDIHIDKDLNTTTLKILDVKNEVQILIGSAAPFSCCLVPAFNNGFYQATRILPVFSLSLKPGEAWSNEFSLKFSH